MQFEGDSSSSDEEEPEIISRKEWQARPPRRVRPFDEPPTNVVYSETETIECKTKQECIKLVQEIQNYHMDIRGLPDIQYHFLVGGDGHVYEGRGWDHIGNLTPKDHSFSMEMSGSLIEVAFIGTYPYESPPKAMFKLASGLLITGMNRNKLIVSKRTDNMLSAGEVEALKKKGTVKISGYGVDTPRYYDKEVEEKEEEEKKIYFKMSDLTK